MPRRGGGVELCHGPKYFEWRQGSLPHPLRREPLAEGAKRSTGDHTRISTPVSRNYRFKSLISTCFVWKIDAARPASTAG